jgi:hypothetical protein
MSGLGRMPWKEEELFEALEHISAIAKSQMMMRRDIAEIRRDLIRMQQAFGLMSLMIQSQLPCIRSPSISPAHT